jgi:putative intracellular protease/amidase
LVRASLLLSDVTGPAAGVPVAAICGATARPARAGRLDDREHTSSAAEYRMRP